MRAYEREGGHLPVIELPGIEDYRKLELEDLEESCRFNTLESRAASGDPEALREYTPSAAQCSPFSDALEGKTDIRAAWRDMVNSQCRSNAEPDTCRADFFSAENRPNPVERIKLDILTFGWVHCSVPYLKTSDLRKSESMRTALKMSFRHRLKIKAYPCSD